MKKAQSISKTYYVYDGDREMIEWARKQLGMNRSDFVRRALQYHARLLHLPEQTDEREQVNTQLGGGP